MNDPYVNRIRKLDWPRLIDLWDRSAAGAVRGWPAGKALEYLVLRAFELEGTEVTWPFEVEMNGSVVEQIDGAMHSDGLSCLLECKDTAVAVNVEPIAKLRNQLLRRPSPAVGLLISRSGFTGPALTLAQFLAPQTILLWNGDEMRHWLERKNLTKAFHRKYRQCVERGIVDYDVRTESIP
jgi:hypothetical protein